MKIAAIVFCIMVLGNSVSAQIDLDAFNRQKQHINQKGFLFLGSWSAANIASGIIGVSSSGGQAKYFHQMNLIWGGVNLLIAIPGYLGARRGTEGLSLENSLKGQAGIEKTFVFNAGLDLAYLAAGAWFLQKANTVSNPDKYKGYGKSILLQGGFLLLFDAVMFSSHNYHGRKLYKLLSSVQMSSNGLGVNVPI